MTSRLYFMFFVAHFAISVSTVEIDRNILLNVFGYSDAVAAPSLTQAQAVVPPNGTLVDLDYWDSEEEFLPAAADYDKFDWTLTKRVAASSNENFLLSPLGLKLALAILAEAATGITQSEIASVLGFDLDRHLVRTKFASIIESLKKKSPEYILDLGSRIYIGDSVAPRQRFAAIAEDFYKTELKAVDFHNTKEAANQINSWVSNTTHGKIPKLVDEDEIAGAVVMILNTLYFKGTWRHQFVPNATNEGIFYVTPQQQIKTQFMRVQNQFYYTESTKFDAKILRMPYRGQKYSFYIIVPNTLTGLPRVLNDLSDLRAEMASLKEFRVEVILPRFNFAYTSHLDDVLRELGIRQAFEDTASFPGIARGQLLHQRLRVSKVLQRSGIEVNELGSVAYSATEISLVNKFGEDDYTSMEVVVNKPFLFFIQDEATRQLLFTGRVSNPSLADGAFNAKA